MRLQGEMQLFLDALGARAEAGLLGLAHDVVHAQLLSGTASRAEVRARFGDPDWHTDAADRYRAGEDHLQLQYRDDRIEVMVAAIGER